MIIQLYNFNSRILLEISSRLMVLFSYRRVKLLFNISFVWDILVTKPIEIVYNPLSSFFSFKTLPSFIHTSIIVITTTMSITSNTPLFKSLTMAESCLLSSKSQSKSKSKPTFFSLPSKSLNLHLSLKTNRSISPSPLFVAQEGDTLTTSLEEEAGLSLDWDPTADAAETETGADDDSAEGDFVEPLEDAKLFVGNLPFDVDGEKLAMLFGQAGTVEIAEVTHAFQFVN